jgi:hypothetical protein
MVGTAGLVAGWVSSPGSDACLVVTAGSQLGPGGQVVGIDMTAEMLGKSRRTATVLGLGHVQFRDGFAEAIPMEDTWADVVISNGSSTCAPASRRCSPRSSGGRGLAGGCWPPTSPTTAPCQPGRALRSHEHRSQVSA